MNIPKFENNVISDLDYEDMVVEIMYEGVSLVTITQEEGYNLLRMRFFHPFERAYWVLPLDDFLTVLFFAKKELWDFRQPGTPNEWEHQHGFFTKEMRFDLKPIWKETQEQKFSTKGN